VNAVIAAQIRAVVEQRLRELAPVAAELNQLQSVLAALDDPAAAAQPAHAAPHPLTTHPAVLHPMAATLLAGVEPAVANANVTRLRRDRCGVNPGKDGRAPQGANKQRILAVIAEHPGIAAPQIARLTGLKRPLVASTVSRLKRNGELQQCGAGVRLPSPEQLAASPAPDAEQVSGHPQSLTHAVLRPA
jgi:hypothetical protein